MNVQDKHVSPGLPASLYNAAGVRAMDTHAIQRLGVPGIVLMRRAAEACVRELQASWPDARRILVYCGKGNNAGDGYIIAGIMAERGCDVSVVAIGAQ